MNNKPVFFHCIDKSFQSRTGGTTHALDRLSLECPAGKITCVLGPTGCGKTTLLRIAAGLETPDNGHVTIKGTSPVQAKGYVGYLTQHPTLLPWLTVQDNVALPLRARGVGKRQRLEISLQTLEQVGLSPAARQYPHECSGGMQQRAMLARLLAADLDTWILDEPFAGLDERTRFALQDLLLKLTTNHLRTVLIVTHDIQEAAYLADQICILSLGPGCAKDIFEISASQPRDRLSADFAADCEHMRRELDNLIITPT